MKHFFYKIRYRLFQISINIDYIKYFITRNKEYDYAFLLEIISKKLTTMGVFFAKHGVVVSEDRKRQVREIWQARKHINNSINGDEIIWEKADKVIYDKFKRHYELKIIDHDDEEGGKPIEIIVANFLPEEQQEVKQLFDSLASATIVYEYQKSELKEAFDIIAEKIFGWWD